MKIFDFIRLIRLNQPSGIWLLLIPCLIGIAFNFKIYHLNFDNILIKTIGLFILGSVLMRSAGCIINDFIDKNFDRNVSRTMNRPLASQIIKSSSALILLSFLLFLSFIILLQFNFATILSGFVAVILIFTYPFMKRFFNFPQLYLGITFNFGIVMASLALTDNIGKSIILLYFICILWTFIYDTIYGFQDIEDDLQMGLKSSSITIYKFFKNPKIILYFLFLIIFLGLFFIGFIHNFSYLYFLLIFIANFFIVLKLFLCDIKNPKNCLIFFKQNVFFGWFILLAIIGA